MRKDSIKITHKEADRPKEAQPPVEGEPPEEQPTQAAPKRIRDRKLDAIMGKIQNVQYRNQRIEKNLSRDRDSQKQQKPPRDLQNPDSLLADPEAFHQQVVAHENAQKLISS